MSTAYFWNLRCSWLKNTVLFSILFEVLPLKNLYLKSISILGKGSSKDDSNTDAMESQQYNSLSSFSSIKSKIKAAVQDKYRKSSSTSLSKQIRSKFNTASSNNVNNPSNGKSTKSSNSAEAMSKFRSHSYGALPRYVCFVWGLGPHGGSRIP